MFKIAVFMSLFLFSAAAGASELIEVRLKGMTGNASQILIRQALEKLPQTEMAEVDALTGRAFIALKNGENVSNAQVRDVIEGLGFSVQDITRSGD